MEQKDEIRAVCDDVVVTVNGEEILDYSDIFLALSEDLRGLPPSWRYAVDWGLRADYNKSVIKNAPNEFFELARSGFLSLWKGAR